MPDETRQLHEALATGPFSLALRLAVRSRGLSLDRLQCKLAERGTPVSKTALSYWQHGRTQPERPDSLRALAVIEEVLKIEAGALSALLGPPRPRGRWLSRKPGTMRLDQAWLRPDGLARALQRMGTTVDAIHWLDPVGVHLSVDVGPDRRLRAIAYHLVLRAERDGVDRRIVAFRSDLATVGLPRVTDTRGCRLGRLRADGPTSFTIFELLLDHPLRLGELTVLSYTLRMTQVVPDTVQTHRIGPSVRDFSVQAAFDPAALPARIFRSYRRSVSEPATEADLWLGGGGTAQYAEVDPVAGIYGIAWDWE